MFPACDEGTVRPGGSLPGRGPLGFSWPGIPEPYDAFVNEYEIWSVVLTGAGFALNVVLFVVLVIQLSALRAQIKDARNATALDHARRKKQATIDFYIMTTERRSELAHLLPYDRDFEGIARHIAKIGQANTRVVRATAEYLDLFETLATGVRTDVFDLEVIEGIATGQIRDMAKAYQPWIAQRRKHVGSETLYAELTALARALESRARDYRP